MQIHSNPKVQKYLSTIYFYTAPPKKLNIRNWYLQKAGRIVEQDCLTEDERDDLERFFDNQHKPELQQWLRHFVDNR